MWSRQFEKFPIWAIYFATTLKITIVRSSPQAEIILTDIQTTVYEKEFVEKLDLRLIPRNKRKAINGSLIYKRSLEKINLRFLLDFEKPDKTHIQMVDFRTDACRIFSGDYKKQKLVKITMEYLTKQTNFIQKCPLEANKNYELIMFDLEMPQFPFPNLKFIFTTTLYDVDNKRKIHEIVIKGATKRKL